MTPKEKAKELYEKFISQNYDFSSFDGNERPENARQCAFICIDEILNTKSIYHSYEENEYWQEVKKELENF